MPSSDKYLTGTSHQNNYVWDEARWSDFNVSFPKLKSIELILISAELLQEAEAHDVLILHFKGKPFEDGTIIVSGDPVKFTYSSGANRSVFEGYVHTVDPVSSIDTHNTKIVCVSASYVLKNSDQAIYKNVTADAVVSKIAKKNSLTAVSQRHPRIQESIVQAGQSDWQLLRRLAKQTGFALRAENTSIIFMSKNKIFESKKKQAPYFKYEDGPTKANRTYGTCFAFIPHVSDDAPEQGSRVDRVVTGVSSITGKVIATTHNVKDFTAASRGVVTPNEAYFDEI
jgi:hypothetical protein